MQQGPTPSHSNVTVTGSPTVSAIPSTRSTSLLAGKLTSASMRMPMAPQATGARTMNTSTGSSLSTTKPCRS